MTSIRCSVVSVIRIVTKQLRLESSWFRYKIALYLSYLQVRFDDEIKRESLRISSINAHYPAPKVKLTSRFGWLHLHSEFTVRYVCNMPLLDATHRRRKAKTTLYGTPMIYSGSLYMVIHTSN